MQIYTSYYHAVRRANVQDVVSISATNPRWLAVKHKHSILAPSYQLLSSFRSEQISEQQYIDKFMSWLNRHDPQQVVDDLSKMSDNPILCCHCGTQHFCHRHLVASWLSDALDITILEYNVGAVNRVAGRIVADPSPEQISLF